MGRVSRSERYCSIGYPSGWICQQPNRASQPVATLLAWLYAGDRALHGDMQGMEHCIRIMYIEMGTPHPPSCSLVSCLSLNIPTLIISVHGLDTIYPVNEYTSTRSHSIPASVRASQIISIQQTDILSCLGRGSVRVFWIASNLDRAIVTVNIRRLFKASQFRYSIKTSA